MPKDKKISLEDLKNISGGSGNEYLMLYNMQRILKAADAKFSSWYEMYPQANAEERLKMAETFVNEIVSSMSGDDAESIRMLKTEYPLYWEFMIKSIARVAMN